MKDRIKLIRQDRQLTQTQFGERIGVKGNTITNYETGLREPSSIVVSSICREFNVNETWLRTGEGDMYKNLSRDEALAAAFGKILSEDDSDDTVRLKKAIINELLAMPPEAWELVLTFLKNISGN